MWEENEFWIDLSWRIDPDGSLGIRQWFESDEHPGTPVGVDEYYGRVFTDGVPGLAEAAAAAGVTPLEFMRDRGAYAVPGDTYAAVRADRRREPMSRAARLTKPACIAGLAPQARGTTAPEALATTKLDGLGDGSPAVDVDGEAKSRLPDAVEEARAVLDDVARLGLARARDAGLDPVARALGGPRPGG